MTPAASDSARIAHLPIAYQRGAAQSAIFDPKGDSASPVAALLAEMNAFLDSLGVSARVAASAPAQSESGALTAPDVRFGCVTTANVPDADCVRHVRGALGRAYEPMHLSVGRPSAAWTEWARGAAREARASELLVITLEVGQYVTRQRGLVGAKEVELGTDHVAKLPWLTSLETPVTVLQLTGALMDTTGRALRIGAEGLVARRTRLLVSAVGGQELIGAEDVAQLRTAVRDELPGKPLVWQVALTQLVEGLTGRTLAPRSAARSP